MRLRRSYGPYKKDSTDGQKGLRPTQDHYARGGTDGTSGTMGRGVAESHDETQYVQQTQYVGTRRTQLARRTDVLNLYYGRRYVFKDRSPYL